MEDVLDVYARLVDPQRLRVCFDETPKQFIAETRQPVPARARQPARFDFEYGRNGTCNLFMFFSPDDGWRHEAVTDRRTQIDFARQMQWLVDVRFPEVAVIDLVLDSLNTHHLAASYEAFEPAEARRIAPKLMLHYTPKHGSWLNMADLEISVFNRVCWNRRIADRATLERETLALENERDAKQSTVTRQFTCQTARECLHRLYPSALS